MSSTGLILNSRPSTTCSLRYVWPSVALLLVGFFCKVPLHVVVGLHMAYLLQEENGERNTFFEFSGLKMVLVRSSVVSAVFSLPFSPFLYCTGAVVLGGS